MELVTEVDSFHASFFINIFNTHSDIKFVLCSAKNETPIEFDCTYSIRTDSVAKESDI